MDNEADDEIVYSARGAGDAAVRSSRDIGQSYYWRFIHDRNQEMMKSVSLDKKIKSFIPYEAGRKIPIHERVAYYMQKLESGEDEKKALLEKSKLNEASKHNASTVKTSDQRVIDENQISLTLTDPDFSISENTPRQVSPKFA